MNPVKRKSFAERFFKNSFFLFISRSIEVGISIAVLGILARYLGVEKTGLYLLLLSIGNFLEPMLHFGLLSILVREISKHMDKAGEILSRIVAGQMLVLLVFVPFFLLVLCFVAAQSVSFAQLLFLVFLYQGVFLNIAKIFRGVFQAFEQMHWDIVVTMVHQFLVLGLVVLAVFSQGYDLPGILTLLAVAAFVQVLFCWALVWYRYASVNIQSMSIRSSLRYLKSGFSVAVSNTCKQGSNYLGVFALKLFFGVTELAFFAAPLRILLRLRIGVMILIRAVAPEFSRRAANEPETLSGVFSFVSRIFLLLGVAGSFILILLKSLILHLILGPEFQDAALCFVIISLFLPFLFFDFFCMSFLIACNQERLNMMNNIKSFVVYIFISLAMVYFFGTFGAAVSFLFINIFISILQFISVKKIIKLKNYLFKVGVLLLSVVLGIFAIYILPKFYYTNIFAGVILFIITAYYFQYFEKKEFNSLQLLLLKKAR